MVTVEQLNKMAIGKFPGYLGIVVTQPMTETRLFCGGIGSPWADYRVCGRNHLALDAPCRRRVVSPPRNMRL